MSALPNIPSQLPLLYRAAFSVAFAAEKERAAPGEDALAVMERAMDRVRAVMTEDVAQARRSCQP